MQENKKNTIISIISWLIIPLLIFGIMYMSFGRTKTDTQQYYEILQYFDNEQVTSYSLDLSSGKLSFVLKGEKETRTYTVPNVSIFLEDVHENVREYNVAHPDAPIKMNYIAGTSTSWLTELLPLAIITVLLILAIVYMMKKMNQSMMSENNRAMSFSRARFKSNKDEDRKTTFDDVAGADEEKEELREIVEFLKSPAKFNDLGARIPKGVLLIGPPGTGKTLLARAVAGEANCPFFSISGSDFVEMYVGVGASRVRDLFDTAKKNAPAIIFIDEIDAVGRHRGAGMGGGHDEREQTLNQLLVEMDGFGANTGIIIIAATNRPDILDPALLRPGRFDRQVTVGYPDVIGREAILKVHSKNKPIGPDVNLHDIACATAGFTGADLENLLNEAALLAAKHNKRAITMSEIEDATIKVVVGTEKRSRKINDKEKRLTAFHEAGHAITNYYLPTLDPVHQISIIPRGMAGGYTMSIPTEDKSYVSKQNMLEEIVSLLGGRVSEANVIGDISTGASNDIERATDITRKMITRYGMSSVLGPIAYGSDNDEVFLGRDYSHVKNYSEETASAIDKEISRIMIEAYDRADDIIRAHIGKLNMLAEYLIKFEKIDGDRFKELMETDKTFDEFMAEIDAASGNTDDKETKADTADTSEVPENSETADNEVTDIAEKPMEAVVPSLNFDDFNKDLPSEESQDEIEAPDAEAEAKTEAEPSTDDEETSDETEEAEETNENAEQNFEISSEPSITEEKPEEEEEKEDNDKSEPDNLDFDFSSDEKIEEEQEESSENVDEKPAEPAKQYTQEELDFMNSPFQIGNYINNMSNTESEKPKEMKKTEAPKVDDNSTKYNDEYDENYNYHEEKEKGKVTENDEIYALYELLKATRDYSDDKKDTADETKNKPENVNPEEKSGDDKGDDK